jgi:hypothetical protein
MFINDNLKTASLAIANVAAGGNIGTAAATVDISSSFLVSQTTAGQALTLPSPTDALAGDRVILGNVGSASFTVSGMTIAPGNFRVLVWSGAAWLIDADKASTGTVVTVASIPAGLSTVAHNFGLPSGSFSSVDFTARNVTGSMVDIRRNTATDTANVVGISSPVALSNITFYLSPLA